MSWLVRLDAPASFQLWLVDLTHEPGEQELATLSADERARADRFVFERDRRRFQAAHVALRRVLSAHTGREAESLSFVQGPYGKPRLAGEPGCAFNLSHCDDVALIALSDDGEVGVDVEVLRSIEDAQELAQRNFTATESAQLAKVTSSQRDMAFLCGWTRKEACLKALGSGLSIAPETFETGFVPGSRIVRIDMPQGHACVLVHSFGHAAHIVGALAQVVSDGTTAPCPPASGTSPGSAASP